uniref:Uncharacterized protein n=1 Tax=Cucumis melo TaxID=3656 RepID=A0A9I9E3A3_CUCME
MLGLETGTRMNLATLKLEFQKEKSSLLIPRYLGEVVVNRRVDTKSYTSL